MSFSPDRVTLVINASIENQRVQTFQDATTVVKYFAVDDLIQPKPAPKAAAHQTASDQAGQSAAKQAPAAVVSYLVVDGDEHDAHPRSAAPAPAAGTKPPPYAARKFEIKEVFRKNLNGAKVQLPSNLFQLIDQGSLEATEPTARIRSYAEKRLVTLKFDGSALSTTLKSMCHEQVYALREALVEQADIRIDAVVEGKLLVSLFVKPVLALQA